MAQPSDGSAEAATSARNQQPQPQETPKISRTNGGSDRITKLRPQIYTEMAPEISTCSFNEFQGHLPFIPSENDMKSCIGALTTNAILTKIDDTQGEADKYRLNNFSAKRKAGVKEPEHFNIIPKVFERLKGRKVRGRKPTYQYFDCPNTKIESDIDGSDNKIDGAMVPTSLSSKKLKTSSSGHRTINIAVACEWKIGASDADKKKNNGQVVSANVQIMNDDVRRMFGYGLTIEGKMMKVWFFCRSYSLVSEEIDIIEEPEKMVMILISFMFATKKEMGYDPSVIRHDHIHYVYTIGNRFFRTHEVISGYRSNNITGRIARIWAAREVESNRKDAPYIGEDECVVKDVWLDAEARTESEIQAALFDDIEQFWKTKPTADRARLEDLWNKHENLVLSGGYKDYFLTHLVDQVGETTKPYNQASFKLKPGLFDIPTPGQSTLQDSPTPSKTESRPQSKSTRQTVAHTMEKSNAPRQRVYDREFSSRRQYRVVFKERCKATVGHLPTLGQVVDILGQTLIPLQLMLCAGWVHRDISSGNILAHEMPAGTLRAKLSDLEYARRFPRENGKVAKDPKTGTPYFMATEILSLRYLSDYSTVPKGTRGLFALPSGDLRDEPRSPAVIHNFQHELESLWWILLWTITARVDHHESRMYAREIFTNSMDLNNARRDALMCRLYLQPILKDSLSMFATYMEMLRRQLFDEYNERFGIENLNNPCSYTDIHNVFQGFFDFLSTDPNSSWTSQVLIKSIAFKERPQDSSQDEEDEDQIHLSAPQRHIRASPSGSTRSYNNLSQSQIHSQRGNSSGRRYSKRHKTGV